MANKEQRVVVDDVDLAMAELKQQHDINKVLLAPDRPVDSQLVITLYKGERVPECHCTVAGRMTGQMVMGAEGSGIMRIDNELRRAQLEMRRKAHLIPDENRKTIEDRLMQTKENSGV